MSLSAPDAAQRRRDGQSEMVARLMKMGSKAIGPFLILLALGLFGLCAFACFTAVGPTVAPTFSLKWWSLAVLGLFVLANVLFNYAACVCTLPGTPQLLLSGPIQPSQGAAAPSAAAAAAALPVCNKCDFLKPQRCHHDSVTGDCVLRFDHMCPWMFNSIGHFNYKYFVLFLAWVWAICVYAAALSWHAFIHNVYRKNSAYLVVEPDMWDSPELESLLATAGEFKGVLFPWVTRRQALRLTTLSFVLPMAAGLAVGGLLSWHIYLVLTNQTTVEWFIRMKQGGGRNNSVNGTMSSGNEFSFGWRTNWQLVFGVHDFPLAWLLPSLAPSPGNGVEYPTLQQPQLLSKQLAVWHARYGNSLWAYVSGTSAERPGAGLGQATGAASAGLPGSRGRNKNSTHSASDVLNMVPLPPQMYSFCESAQEEGFTRFGSPAVAFRRLRHLERAADKFFRGLKRMA